MFFREDAGQNPAGLNLLLVTLLREKTQTKTSSLQNHQIPDPHVDPLIVVVSKPREPYVTLIAQQQADRPTLSPPCCVCSAAKESSRSQESSLFKAAVMEVELQVHTEIQLHMFNASVKEKNRWNEVIQTERRLDTFTRGVPGKSSATECVHDTESHLQDTESNQLDTESHQLDTESHLQDTESNQLDTESHLLDTESHLLDPEPLMVFLC
ncbi:unnamed protein product [Pleuronectes platessa]|uniref:Uncharacterized protein n=1 Tax=Pleuronectes platessa TaxID=8262 RepID=A0A9N7UBV0_PLEPL|nr:unnamed protein product [Pleuronectes platessa]